MSYYNYNSQMEDNLGYVVNKAPVHLALEVVDKIVHLEDKEGRTCL